MIDRNQQLAMLLDDALSIAEENEDPALLQHLRDARRAMPGGTDATATVNVDLLAGRLVANGALVPITKREFAIVAALSLCERGVPPAILAEDLYPNSDPRCAANAVKVYVHRVRRRVGSSHVIRFERGRYVLSNSVQVDLLYLETVLRTLVRDRPLSPGVRARLRQFHRRLRKGRPEFMLEWDWFAETERRLEQMTRDITVVLADDSLRRGDRQSAIAFASDLSTEDPLDEAAPDITIRAWLSAGNRTAAWHEYERYAGVLRRELGSSPPGALRGLFDEPHHQDFSVQRAQRYVAGTGRPGSEKFSTRGATPTYS